MNSRDSLIEAVDNGIGCYCMKDGNGDRVLCPQCQIFGLEERQKLVDAILSAGFIHKSEAPEYCELGFPKFPDLLDGMPTIKLKDEVEP